MVLMDLLEQQASKAQQGSLVLLVLPVINTLPPLHRQLLQALCKVGQSLLLLEPV